MIEFFTDPWNIILSQWTMKIIVSALIQIGFGYLVFVYCLVACAVGNRNN